MSTIRELTDDDFTSTVSSNEAPVLVQFSATWCQPCKALTPTIEAISKEYEGRLDVFKVDIDQAQETAQQFDIRGVPTCVFLRTGEVVDRFAGNLDLRSIKERVEKVLA